MADVETSDRKPTEHPERSDEPVDGSAKPGAEREEAPFLEEIFRGEREPDPMRGR